MNRDLPPGWEGTTLGEVIDGFEAGRNLKAQGRPALNGEFGVLKISAVSWGRFDPRENKALLPGDKPKARELVRAGDLLISRANTSELVGAVVKVHEDHPTLMLPDKVLRLRVKEARANPDFLKHALRTRAVREHFEREATGTSDSMRNLSQPKMRAAPILLPPLDQQRLIVEKIEALTAKSRRAKESLDAIPPLLDRFRKSVLAAAFRGDLTKDWRAKHSDVEPIAAAIERVQLEELGSKTGRSATVNTIEGRAALAVGMPKSPAPPGWQWTELASVARLESGHTPSRKHPEWWGGDVPWIGIKDARSHHGNRISQTLQNTNDEGLANSAARLLPAGTVCLSRTASVGYVVIMGRPMATSQDFVNWVCSEAVVPEFLMYLFLAEGDHLLKFGKGTTHTTIYFPEVKAFHVCLPPVEEQRAIVARVRQQLDAMESIWATMQAAQTSAQTLDSAILAKAFRGELVPNE